MLDWHFSISGTRNRNQEYQIQHTLLKKKWQKKEQSNNHWLGWQIISNITACESHWHTLHHSQEQHFKKPETLLWWAKNIQNTVRSMNNQIQHGLLILCQNLSSLYPNIFVYLFNEETQAKLCSIDVIIARHI